MSELKPGLELDALVAEKVMEWHKPTEEEWKAAFTVIPLTLWQYQQLTLEHYSTDIAAAWKVVEHFDFTDVHVIWQDTTCQWSCRIGKDEFRSPDASSDESAAHAICLAALEAVGISIR